MKTKIFLVLLAMAMMVFPTSLIAGVDAWTTGAVIQKREQSNRTLVKTSPMINPRGCSNSDYYVLEQTGYEYQRRLRQDIFVAYDSYVDAGRVITSNVMIINIGLMGCSDGDYNGYPVISETWLK
jgi:hypothetical protein